MFVMISDINKDFLLQLWRHIGESVYNTFTLRCHRVGYLSEAIESLPWESDIIGQRHKICPRMDLPPKIVQ